MLQITVIKHAHFSLDNNELWNYIHKFMNFMSLIHKLYFYS